MKRFLLLFFLINTTGASYAMTPQQKYNAVYTKLKTEGLSRVRDSCVNGKKFNSLNISYWEPGIKEARENQYKIALLEATKGSISDVSISDVNEYVSYYYSALIAVMKEMCPNVW